MISLALLWHHIRMNQNLFYLHIYLPPLLLLLPLLSPQAMVDFLLADPEDEALWEGILYAVPYLKTTASTTNSRVGHGPSYWQSALLDGALEACTPGVAERRLRSALQSVGDGAGRGGGGMKGDSGVFAAASAVVLRGLCRLARSAWWLEFFFCTGWTYSRVAQRGG